eukprot:m.114060 g.114060  ORF g.114060 m.114060 type:complete len:833 (-) comp17116_c0_seq3:4358-6856(-)
MQDNDSVTTIMCSNSLQVCRHGLRYLLLIWTVITGLNMICDAEFEPSRQCDRPGTADCDDGDISFNTEKYTRVRYDPTAYFSTTGYNGSAIEKWSSRFRSKHIDNTILELFEDINEQYQTEDERGGGYDDENSYFGHIVPITMAGLRLGQSNVKKYGNAAKEIIKEVVRLRKSRRGIQSPLASFLWKQLAMCIHYNDEIAGYFFARLVIKAGLLETINAAVMDGGWTNLMLAARAGDVYVVNAMVIAGVDVTKATQKQETALHIVLDAWNLEQQLSHGTRCSQRDFSGIIWTLSNHPALDLQQRDNQGQTVVMLAAHVRHTAALELLASRAGDLTAAPASDILNAVSAVSHQSALHLAVTDSDHMILFAKWAMRHGNHFVDNRAFRDECVHNSLARYNVSASDMARAAIVPWWLPGATLPTSGAAGKSGILRSNVDGISAVVHRWTAQHVRSLLAHGASTGVLDSMGRTPLHWAAAIGNRPAVQHLLDAGAASNVTDRYGLSPYDLAQSGGYVDVAEILVQRDMGVQHNGQDGSTATYGYTDQDHNGAHAVPRHIPRVEPYLGVHWGEQRTTPVGTDEALDAVRCDLDVRDDLSPEEFERDYWGKNRPVLIRRAIDPAYERNGYKGWDKVAFLKDLGEYELQRGRTKTGMQSKTSSTTIKEFLAYVQKQRYLLNVSYEEATPSEEMIIEARWNDNPKLHARIMGLMKSVAPMQWMKEQTAKVGWPLNNYQMNIGAPYSGTSVHFHYPAISGLVHGRKRWRLFPPRYAFYSNAHFFDDFADVKEGVLGPSLECTQQEGDVLYVPSLWGHGVLYEEVSVSISFLYGLPGGSTQN